MQYQSLRWEPNFQKRKKLKPLIYKLCFLFTLHSDIIRSCSYKHWILLSSVNSCPYFDFNWLSFITRLIRRLLSGYDPSSEQRGVTVVIRVVLQAYLMFNQLQDPRVLAELNSSPASAVVCRLPPLEHGAAVCPYGRALEMCGGVLVLIGANSSGHLPGLSLLACVLASLTTQLKDTRPLVHMAWKQ